MMIDAMGKGVVSGVYKVPWEKLHIPLRKPRQSLMSIGYPMANNAELNVPDSVIRLHEDYHIETIEEHDGYNVYYVGYRQYE